MEKKVGNDEHARLIFLCERGINIRETQANDANETISTVLFFQLSIHVTEPCRQCYMVLKLLIRIGQFTDKSGGLRESLVAL